MDKYARRRLVVNLVLGTLAVGAGALLIKPRIVALLDGSLAVIGVGAVANLVLLCGGLLFLREAQRAYSNALARPDEELKPGAAPGSPVE